jgi:hypothetical protein
MKERQEGSASPQQRSSRTLHFEESRTNEVFGGWPFKGRFIEDRDIEPFCGLSIEMSLQQSLRLGSCRHSITE